MKEDIKNILEDLYTVDDSLRKYESQLIDLIDKLLKSKPNIKFDKNFQIKLRQELLEKFSENNNKQTNFNIMNKLLYVFGSLALILLILIPSLSKNERVKTAQVDFSLQVQRLDKQAFGPLLAQNTGNQEVVVGAGFGGGGGGMNTTASVDMKIAPQPMVFKYVYKGDDFSIDSDQMPVLKKIKGLDSQKDVAKVLQNLNFDNINLNSLDNLRIRNFTIYEDKNFGYSVNVDLYEGMISINENWEKWPMSMGYSLEAIKMEDVPSDEQLINMANKFLQEHNISVDKYGAPQVDNSWKENYLRFVNKADFVIPDMATVIYPLLIDGKSAYEEWGTVQGLRVAINLRYKRVSSMWNLSSQKYQSSLYDMETDVSRILELASRGGNYYYPEQSGVKVVEIELDTPYLAYMQTWQYSNNVSNELLVPALVFPIVELPSEAEYFYKQNVVIPLAKDILDQRMGEQEFIPVDIMEEAPTVEPTIELDK